MKSNLIKGILLVSFGAACYGILGVFVELGRQQGYTIEELTFAQHFIGWVLLVILFYFGKWNRKNNSEENLSNPSTKEKWNLIIGGVPLALTSVFLYSSFKYVSVPIAIVLLMQSVWMGSIFDYFINKVKPSLNKIAAIIAVLIGTVLATNVLDANFDLHPIGLVFGLLAGLSFTTTMFASNNIAVRYTPTTRGMYMALGALIMVILIFGYSLTQQFDLSVLWKWGFILAIFGVVLPPVLFNKGFPLVGLGLGTILGAVELPVSVIASHFILHVSTNIPQWIGIFIILAAVVLMNVKVGKK